MFCSWKLRYSTDDRPDGIYTYTSKSNTGSLSSRVIEGRNQLKPLAIHALLYRLVSVKLAARIGHEGAIVVRVQANLPAVPHLRRQMRGPLRLQRERPPRVADDREPDRLADRHGLEAEVGSGDHQELLRRVPPRGGLGAGAEAERVRYRAAHHAQAGRRVEELAAAVARHGMAIFSCSSSIIYSSSGYIIN